MNPFPQTILTPVTANRIPRTDNADEVVTKLLEFGINASAFFMEADQLDAMEDESFVNDFDRAFEDFFYQISPEIRWKVFLLELESPAEASCGENSESGCGMAAVGQQKGERPTRHRHGLAL